MSDQPGGMTEARARFILEAAIQQTKAADLLACLFDGGMVTTNPDGRLVLVPGDQVAALVDPDR